MQITFRFNGSETIEVSNYTGGVNFEHIREAVTQGASGEAEVVIEPEKRFFLSLSKSGARSIASALMQAAAEA